MNASELLERNSGRKGSDASVEHGHELRTRSDTSQLSNGSSTMLGNFTLETGTASPMKERTKEGHKGGFMTLGHKTKFRDVLRKINMIPAKFMGLVQHSKDSSHLRQFITLKICLIYYVYILLMLNVS